MHHKHILFAFIVFLSTTINAQDYTLLKNHSENSFNGIDSDNPGAVRSSDNLYYYIAATAGTSKRSIYSTDGTPEGTKKVFNHSSFAGDIFQLGVADDVLYVIDNENRLYAAIDNEMQFVEDFTFDLDGIYPVNSGVYVFEERPSGEYRIHYFDRKNNIEESLGSYDIFNSIVTSKWGELTVISDQSTSSSTERTIITDGTSQNTFLLEEYLSENDIINFTSIKNAIAFENHLVITAKTSSNSFQKDYIIDLETKAIKEISLDGSIFQVEGLNGKVLIKSQYSIYTFDPITNQLSTLSSDANIFAKLFVHDEYAFYFQDESNENNEYDLRYTDGTTQLNESFYDISTSSPSLFNIQKVGQDYAIIKSDESSFVSIFRTTENEFDTISNLTYVGNDFILLKVKGRLLFSKYTSDLGDELYRSDKIVDNDEDGFDSSEDCDEANPLINPGAIEISGNTIDENCDGDISTGVVENSTNNLSAYPNPVHELLHIDQYDINQNKATLLDMVGNVVRVLTPGTNEIAQLSSGVYFIKFETFKSKKLLFKKIVKL